MSPSPLPVAGTAENALACRCSNDVSARVGDHVYGSEVNAAAKLGEDIAGHGEILVTDAVRAQTNMKHEFAAIDRVPPGALAAFRLIM